MTKRNILAGSRLTTGHVYLIAPVKPKKNWVNGIGTVPFKIGVSKSIKGVYKRLNNLSTGNWEHLVVANISPEIFRPYDVELYLHKNYSKRNIKGEWFKLSYAEYQYIVDALNREPDEFEPMSGRGEHIREWGFCYSRWP